MSLIDNIRKKAFHIRGTFDNFSDLPTTAIEGDYAIVLSTKTIWIYANNTWHDSGGTGGGGGGGSISWGQISGNILSQTDLRNALNGKANLVPSAVLNNILQTNAAGQPIDSGKTFSTDTSLIDNADTKIPTQKAVKTYIDTALNAKMSNALPSGNIYVGNGVGVATPVAVSGDATISNTGVLTIGSGAITGAKIANNTITATQIADNTITGTKIASSVALSGNPTTTTQAVNDNSTKVATTEYVDRGLGTKTSSTLTSGKIYVGDASNVATPVAVSGDATISNAGVLTVASGAITGAKIATGTITADKITPNSITGEKLVDGAITNSKLANAASNTWKGNNTSSLGAVSDNPLGKLTASGPLTVSGGANSLLNDANLSITKAGATSDGFLSNADWIAFSGKQDKTFVTVGGGEGTDFQTVKEALNAGADNILIVSEVEQETLTEPLYIDKNTNIILRAPWWISAPSHAIVAVKDLTLSIKMELGVGITYGAFTPNSYFFTSSEDTTSVSFAREDFNISLGITSSIIGRLHNVYSVGTSEVFSTECSISLAFNYDLVTGYVSENSTIILRRASVGMINYSTGTIPFYVKEVIFEGDAEPNSKIINITSGYIGNIVNNMAFPVKIGIGGTLLGLSGLKAKVNVQVLSDNTVICNASNIDVLDLNGKSGFKGVNIVGNSKIDAAGAQFSNCVFGGGVGARGISTGSIYENIDLLNLFTSSLTGDDVLNNGTLGYPFATVLKALEYATYNSIIHLRGTFNESILFDLYDNQILRGENIVFEPLTKINGQIVITNQSERIYLSDLAIHYDADAPIVVNSTNGAHGLNNLHLTTTYSKVIFIDYTTSQKTNKMFISNTDFRTTSGLIYLDDILEGGTGTLELDNCIEVKIYIGAGWSVISNNTSFYSVQGVNASYITILNQGETLATLGDIFTNNLSNKDTLVYNSSNQKWENKPLGTISGMNAVSNPIENDILLTDSSGQAIDSGKSFSTDGTFSANSDSLIPTQKAVRDYALNKFANDFSTSFPEKLSSDFADVILIEDSANSGSKAYLPIGNINVDGGTF
jgi:hypothetical protein